jgi:hypothetical protein
LSQHIDPTALAAALRGLLMTAFILFSNVAVELLVVL